MGQWLPPWMGQWLGLGSPSFALPERPVYKLHWPNQMRKQRREEKNKFQWLPNKDSKTKTGAGLDKCSSIDYDESTREKKRHRAKIFSTNKKIRDVDWDRMIYVAVLLFSNGEPPTISDLLPPDPADLSRPPHIIPSGLCLWTLHIWKLASIKIVPMPGSWPVKQFPETLSRQEGVRKKKWRPRASYPLPRWQIYVCWQDCIFLRPFAPKRGGTYGQKRAR